MTVHRVRIWFRKKKLGPVRFRWIPLDLISSGYFNTLKIKYVRNLNFFCWIFFFFFFLLQNPAVLKSSINERALSVKARIKIRASLRVGAISSGNRVTCLTPHSNPQPP
jgi:hypothetical protein